MTKLTFAMVCASNQNRSMEAHKVLAEAGFSVTSYGVGTQVKLPGPSVSQPNCYCFGTPYEVIYEDLKRKDLDLYTQNGLLTMLERNIKVKRAPERWQDNTVPMDVAITFEERVMDVLVEDMTMRNVEHMRPVLVINLDVKDNAAEAANAAPQAQLLCDMLENSSDWEDESNLDDIFQEFERETGRRLLYTIVFF